MDIQKEREAFEQLPAVAKLIKTNDVWWSDVHGDYFGSDHELDCWIDGAWAVWQAKSQVVPEGFVLVPEDQAKDTERLNFLLGDNRYIRTVVQRDIENEDYEKTGEHYLFTELFWIDGWDYHENTSSQSERGAIDKAMIKAQEQSQ
ncbi:hypothetical protein [Acinetobacter tandoii]